MSESPESTAIRRLLIHRSASSDVYENLAREEYLLDRLPADTLGFLLYSNSESLVLGKHQNPWREVDLGAARALGVCLARRISGGGTVFHDRGNLNFSFIIPRRNFDRRANLEVVVRALDRLGILAEVSPRYDILAGGRKISGNAFCFRREMVLHHGTLLVEARIDRLGPLLKGLAGAAERTGRGSVRIETHAVESRPAQVVNLRELQAGITPERIADELTAEIVRYGGALSGAPFAGSGGKGGAPEIEMLAEDSFDAAEVRSLRERNQRVGWLLDGTPRFEIELRMDAGGRSLRLSVEEGRVVSAESGLAGLAGGELLGRRFDAAELSGAIALAQTPESVAFAVWLKGLGF